MLRTGATNRTASQLPSRCSGTGCCCTSSSTPTGRHWSSKFHRSTRRKGCGYGVSTRTSTLPMTFAAGPMRKCSTPRPTPSRRGLWSSCSPTPEANNRPGPGTSRDAAKSCTRRSCRRGGAAAILPPAETRGQCGRTANPPAQQGTLPKCTIQPGLDPLSITIKRPGHRHSGTFGPRQRRTD